jgi:hypothetical protein
MVNHPNRSKTKLLKFNVLNRYSGEVQFTAEIDCADDAKASVKLGLAVKWAIESRAYLSGADLSGANLSRIDPTGVGWGLRLNASGKSKGYPIYIVGGDHADFPLFRRDGKAWAEIVQAEDAADASKTFVYRPRKVNRKTPKLGPSVRLSMVDAIHRGKS